MPLRSCGAQGTRNIPAIEDHCPATAAHPGASKDDTQRRATALFLDARVRLRSSIDPAVQRPEGPGARRAQPFGDLDRACLVRTRAVDETSWSAGRRRRHPRYGHVDRRDARRECDRWPPGHRRAERGASSAGSPLQHGIRSSSTETRSIRSCLTKSAAAATRRNPRRPARSRRVRGRSGPAPPASPGCRLMASRKIQPSATATPAQSSAPKRVEQQEFQIAQADRAGHASPPTRSPGMNLAKSIDAAPQRAKIDSVCATQESGESEILAQGPQHAESVAAARPGTTACRRAGPQRLRLRQGNHNDPDVLTPGTHPATISVGYAGTGTPACSTNTFKQHQAEAELADTGRSGTRSPAD